MALGTRPYCSGIAAARPDLVKFDDIARRIFDKHLIGIFSDKALDLPEPDPFLLQFALRLFDVFHSQCNVWQRRMFADAAGQRRTLALFTIFHVCRSLRWRTWPGTSGAAKWRWRS